MRRNSAPTAVAATQSDPLDLTTEDMLRARSSRVTAERTWRVRVFTMAGSPLSKKAGKGRNKVHGPSWLGRGRASLLDGIEIRPLHGFSHVDSNRLRQEPHNGQVLLSASRSHELSGRDYCVAGEFPKVLSTLTLAPLMIVVRRQIACLIHSSLGRKAMAGRLMSLLSAPILVCHDWPALRT